MRSGTGLLFVLPAVIVLFLLVAYPIAYTGLLSVSDNQGALVGFKNFAAVLKPSVTTQPEFSRPSHSALHHANSLGHPRNRRGHNLGLDVPHRIWHRKLYVDGNRYSSEADWLAHE